MRQRMGLSCADSLQNQVLYIRPLHDTDAVSVFWYG